MSFVYNINLSQSHPTPWSEFVTEFLKMFLIYGLKKNVETLLNSFFNSAWRIINVPFPSKINFGAKIRQNFQKLSHSHTVLRYVKNSLFFMFAFRPFALCCLNIGYKFLLHVRNQFWSLTEDVLLILFEHLKLTFVLCLFLWELHILVDFSQFVGGCENKLWLN